MNQGRLIQYKYVFLGLIVFLCVPYYTEAATLFIQNSKSTISENDTVTTSIFVNSENVSINNTEGVVSFPSDLLSVQSVSTAGSVLPLWVENPSFSNTDGIINFNGGVPNPGYNGSSGKILTIVFKAKRAGSATISFNSGTVRANDGMGTDVTSTKSPATITIQDYTGTTNSAPTTLTEDIPLPPVITSAQIPTSDTWYSQTSATFKWNLPKNVDTVQVLLGKFPNSIPTISYSPAIAQKTIDDLPDGVWYIHARFKNGAGWSNTSHYKIKIDNTAPKNLTLNSEIKNNDLISLNVTATDSTSGVVKYVVFVDDEKIMYYPTTGNESSESILLPALQPGKRKITVRAFDAANNSIEENTTVNAPEIKTPKIIEFPESITSGERISIKGVTPYPKSEVVIWVQEADKEPVRYQVSADERGIFAFTTNYIKSEGLISIWSQALVTNSNTKQVAIWTQAMTNNGVLSIPSEKAFVMVKPTPFTKLSANALHILSLLIPIVAVLLGLVLLAYYIILRIRKIRRQIVDDLNETDLELHAILSELRKDIEVHLRLLEKTKSKRQLTNEENTIIDHFNEYSEKAEEYLTKRIKHIEKNDL